MAEIYVNKTNNFQQNLIEDPQLSYNRLFIGTKAHDTTTLAPLWMKEFHFTSNTLFTYDTNTSDASVFGVMSLTKGSTNCFGNGDSQVFDMTAWEIYHKSLDFSNYPASRVWAAVQNDRSLFLYHSVANGLNNSNAQVGFQVHGKDCTSGTGSIYTAASSWPTKFMYEDTVNNVLYGMSDLRTGGDWVNRMTNYSSGTAPTLTQIDQTAQTRQFFLGVDNNNWTFWLRVADNTAAQYHIYKVNPTTFAVTVCLTASNRSLATNYLRTYPSNIYRTSANRRIFYSSHFDSTSNLAPIRYTFDAAVGNVWANNCTVTYPAGTGFTNYGQLFQTTGVETTQNGNSWHMKPHQFLASDGNRYITFVINDKSANFGSGTTRWNTTARRTMLTYKIEPGTGTTLAAANDDVLQYHSAYAFASVTDIPKTFLPLSANGDFMAVPRDAGVDFLSFTPTANAGWTKSSSYPVEMRQIGLDQSNRLWGTSYEKGYGVVHAITPSVPVRISIVMAANTYSYTGSNVYTTAAVNAYDGAGARIASTLNLTIDGSSMVFQSSNTRSNTIITSTSADTTLELVITGGGVNNIIANISI